jgi:hypothetical protein
MCEFESIFASISYQQKVSWTVNSHRIDRVSNKHEHAKKMLWMDFNLCCKNVKMIWCNCLQVFPILRLCVRLLIWMNVKFKGSRFLFQSDFLWSVEFHLRTREDFVSGRLRDFSEIKPEIHTRPLRLFLSNRTGWLARCMRTKMGHLILHTYMCACVCVCVR